MKKYAAFLAVILGLFLAKMIHIIKLALTGNFMATMYLLGPVIIFSAMVILPIIFGETQDKKRE